MIRRLSIKRSTPAAVDLDRTRCGTTAAPLRPADSRSPRPMYEERTRDPWSSKLARINVTLGLRGHRDVSTNEPLILDHQNADCDRTAVDLVDTGDGWFRPPSFAPRAEPIRCALPLGVLALTESRPEAPIPVRIQEEAFFASSVHRSCFRIYAQARLAFRFESTRPLATRVSRVPAASHERSSRTRWPRSARARQ